MSAPSRRALRAPGLARSLITALRIEGFRLLLIGGLAGLSIALLQRAFPPDDHRWAGRHVTAWRASAASSSAAVRDSAMAALAMLEPHAPETIELAAQLLGDTDSRVSTGAIRELQEAARARPASAASVQRALAWTLRTGGSRARQNAARVVGALGADAAPLLSALVDAGTDSADATRAAVATALGAVLEGAPLTSAPVRDRALSLLFQMMRDPAWPVRDAALEGLLRGATLDHRLANAIAVARMDPRTEVRERALAATDSGWR